MVRFVKGEDTHDLWIASTDDAEELWCRDNGGEARQLPTRWAFSADRDLRTAMTAKLAAGWRCLGDPAHAVAEPIDPTLDAALRADLGDATSAAVYADWYQQRQHPRGELIALSLAELDAEIEQLLERERRTLLGPLDRPRVDYHLGVELAWQHGFVRAARLDGKGDSEAELLLAEILCHPSTRFLRELVIGCHKFGDQDNSLMTALLLHADPAPPLRTLVLADFDDSHLDNIDISRADLGDLTGLAERYPLLEDVVLKGRLYEDTARPDGGLRGLALPRCRRFAFRTSGMRAAMLAAILAAPWPELGELELWTGTPDYGCDCTAADLAPLLRAPPPKLHTLRLLDCDFVEELLPALVALHAAHPLTELDLSLGTLGDEGAAWLLAHAGELRGLARLRLYDNCVPARRLAELRVALPLVEDPPFPGAGWDQGDYHRTERQKQRRYVSVSE